MSGGGAARFPWWFYAAALALILAFAFWPVIGVLVSGAIAESHGCVLNEAGPNPCLVGGADWGRALYGGFVLGWFMLATIPMGAGALAVLAVSLIIHQIFWRRARRPR